MISAILLSLFFILAVVIGIQPVFAADFLGGAVGFDFPTDIASSDAGHFVINSDSNSVVILDGLLQRVLTFGNVDLNTDGDNNDDGELDAPYGIAVNTENIFVTDTGNNRVQIFDLDGNYVSQFGSVDLDGSKDNGEFDTPRGIAVNDENIFVVDTGYDRIQVFDLDGNYVRQFGSSDFDGPGNNSGEFRQPRGIEVTPDRVYVTDEISDKIVVFDLDGNHLISFGGSGDGDGQFDFPASITRERTGLFVVDSHNRRVQVFDVNGNYLDQFSTDFTLNTGVVVQIDPEGHTSFLTDANGTTVIVTYPSVLANVLIVFGYGEPPIRDTSEHITGTATISQPTLPTITFNDATVDIALNSEGVGSVAFASLVDGTIVSTENLGGSNVIQFILDPDDAILSLRNPNTAGVVNDMPFEIPSFQTGAHTVVYNKTHFTFNFDDPTFTGTTPNVILQANIQSDADTLPAIHEDKANIAFNITSVTQICSSSVGAVSLDFGSLKVGVESSDGTIVVDNDGNVPVNVDIGADPWCDALDNGCTSSSTANAVNTAVMQPSVTRFVGDVPPFPGEVPLYAAKTPFTNFDFDTTLTPVTRGNSTHLYADNDLFTLEHDEDGTAYLQVSIALPAESDGSPGRFAGDVTQGIWFSYDCDP